MLFRTVTIVTAFAAIAACTSPAERQQNVRARAAGEFLERIDPIADPGKVAATDFAFARAARENGQWSAFAEYAAPDAQLDEQGGFVAASSGLSLRTNPAQSVSWAPQIVWSSCDGTLAVSSGRFQQVDGKVGTYMTAWQLQPRGLYRWIYRISALDDPQPVRRAPVETPSGEDVIVVEQLSVIEGKAADCTASGEPAPAPAPEIIADSSQYQIGRSADGTLQYRWEHRAVGSRRLVVDYVRDGAWERVLNLAVPAASTP